MTAKSVAFVFGLIGVAVFVPRGNAEPATLPHTPPREGVTPDTTFERKIPDEILKLQGKTVRFSYGVDLFHDGRDIGDETRFVLDLLNHAGINARVLAWDAGGYVPKPGDILVLNDPPVSELSAKPTALEIDAHEHDLKFKATWDEIKKRWATGATTAGAQVVPGDQMVAFFGLAGVTRREIEQYKDERENRAIVDELDLRLPIIKLDAVGLSDVIDFLRDVNGAKIFVNWKMLEAAGIDRQAPVTAELKNVKFDQALQIVLDSAAGAKGKLTSVIDDGMIVVSTVEDLKSRIVIRKMYDIHFLLPANLDAAAREARVEALRKLLTGSVDPKSWGVHGRNRCAAIEMDGELIVAQTEKNQKAVENLLKHLQELMVSSKP